MLRLLLTAAFIIAWVYPVESKPSRYRQYAEFCGSRYCSNIVLQDWRWHRAESGQRRAYRGKPKYRHDRRAKRYAKASYSPRYSRPSGDVRRSVRAHPVPKKAYAGTAATVVAHPPGCPSRAFCGCGVSLYVYGEKIRSLYLAANWLKFPETKPGPGMVAARKGHVFAIIRDLGDGRVLAYDPNSGRRKTRIHIRSLAGFRVVNPHGRSAA